jgi:hypothetical protein
MHPKANLTVPWLVTILLTACAGMRGDGSPGKYNAMNGYGMPKDDNYVSYFDQAVEGPTADVLVGLLPASLERIDSLSDTYKALASTAPNTADFAFTFESANEHRICFSTDVEGVDLMADHDDLIDDFKDTEFSIHAIRDRAAIQSLKIWPVQGSTFDQYEVTDDETKTPTVGGPVRTIEVRACGPKPPNLDGAAYLAVVVGGKVTGATDHGLMLWKLAR